MVLMFRVFFFKQKTAYEMRISDWSSDVCSSDLGPCGPCSEIFFDHGEHIPGGPPGSPDEDGDRFVEIWNLVFMQYEQMDKETRVDLPRPPIDKIGRASCRERVCQYV